MPHLFQTSLHGVWLHKPEALEGKAASTVKSAQTSHVMPSCLSWKGLELQGCGDFPGGSAGKESTCNVGDVGSTPGLGRSPGGGHGNPLQCSCLENPRGQKSLVGCSPWGRTESDVTEWLTTGGVFALIWLAVTWVYIYIKVYTCTLKMSVLQYSPVKRGGGMMQLGKPICIHTYI